MNHGWLIKRMHFFKVNRHANYLSIAFHDFSQIICLMTFPINHSGNTQASLCFLPEREKEVRSGFVMDLRLFGTPMDVMCEYEIVNLILTYATLY